VPRNAISSLRPPGEAANDGHLHTFPRHDIELKYPVWQKLYYVAMTEIHDTKLEQKILDAEAALFQREQRLSSGGLYEDAFEELLVIQDALTGLRVLRREGTKKGLSYSGAETC
jgi:hypothetical protein